MAKDRSLQIDETDLKILRLLQEDAKMGVKKIAEQVGKGISTIHARIKSMEQKKIITKYSAILDPLLLNRPIMAFIFISLSTKGAGKKGVGRSTSGRGGQGLSTQGVFGGRAGCPAG